MYMALPRHKTGLLLISPTVKVGRAFSALSAQDRTTSASASIKALSSPPPGPDLEPEWTFVSGTVVAADQKRLVVSPQANFGRLPHPLLARYMDRDRVSCSAKSSRKRRFWPPQNGIVGSLAETDWSGSAAVSGNTRRSDEQRMRFGGYGT
ncbi:hypothetical protein MGG_11688 [Pyricularia oryzae 70-15]|uniref:Uncharacterized protein n=1 Tax=Pyricularia oryzae (strain 70-15 / ATCC MYA-4617 / FGSC 8958) TaxID=242507 RepID=G4NEV1_PYRO7|nr:uncharacterized protein MGG_11688 [Pyricularia oryzae 70-15]EHA49524.1 hypothetical protein MGG_11688 [Pyricularia oryzae 70-15]